MTTTPKTVTAIEKETPSAEKTTPKAELESLKPKNKENTPKAPEHSELHNHARETRSNLTDLDLEKHQSDVETTLAATDRTVTALDATTSTAAGAIDYVAGSNLQNQTAYVMDDLRGLTQDEEFRKKYGDKAVEIQEALRDPKKAQDVADKIQKFEIAAKKLEEKREKLRSWGVSIEEKISAKERADQVFELYTAEDENGKVELISHKDLRKKQWDRLKNIKDDINEHGIFKGVWTTLSHTYAMGSGYSFAKNNFEAFQTYHAASEAMDKMSDIHQETEQIIDEAGETIESAVETAKDVKDDVQATTDKLKESPAGLYVARQLTAKMTNKEEKILNQLAKAPNDPKKQKQAVRELQKLYGESISEGMKNGGQEFMNDVKNGKYKRFTLKKSGKLMLVEVGARSLMDLIRGEKTADETINNIANANIWAEAAPIYGSYKSFQRFFEDNGDPWYAKAADFGLNIVGDGVFVVGLIGAPVTGGGSAAAGTAARGGLGALGKSFLKKSVTKGMIKKAPGATAKLAGETALAAGKLSVAAYIIEESLGFAFDKFLPDKETLVQVAVDEKNRVVEEYLPGAGIIQNALAN